MDKGITTRARKKQPSAEELSTSVARPKKKTVTFKNILETSDDVNIIKRVYNPDIVPAVPIIKISKSYDALSRSERFARGDIVMPSRLTEVLKNYSANLDIDKLSLLTFKSTNSTPPMDADDGQSQDADDSHPTVDESAPEPEPADDEAGAATLSAGGDKKFVLPRRSAHSCRVIKPNKRFLDDSNISASAVGKTGRRASTSSKIQLPADNFINNTLSSQINKSKLDEADDGREDVKPVERDDDSESNSSDASEVDATETESVASSKESTAQKSSFNLFSKSAILFNPPSPSYAIKPSTSPLAASKLILRQPLLNFQSSISTNNSSTEGPFSLNLDSIMPTASTQNVCSVCSSPTNKCHQTSRKFGFSSCEACRKFISKMLKTPSSSSLAHQCTKINCELKPTPAIKLSGHSKIIRSIIKERCQSCWLQKCIQLCPELKTKLPNSSAFSSTTSVQSNSAQITSPYRIKIEQNSETPSTSTNIFANNLGGVGKLLAWPAMDKTTTGGVGDNDYRPKMSISNALVENNSTFGSSPLIKPMITEKPVIMVDNKVKDEVQEKPTKIEVKAAPSTSNNSNKPVIIPVKQTKEPVEEISRLRQRKKEVITVPTASANPLPPASTTSSSSSTASVPLVTSETAKRQRIDLKGPRVKHVCRSASIVLGQPLATFPPDEATVLENMDTPPRPDSPNSTSVELPAMLVTQTQTPEPSGDQFPCSDCKPNSPLSPPNTPTTMQSSDENELSNYSSAMNTVDQILNNEEHQHDVPPQTTDKLVQYTVSDSAPITIQTDNTNTEKTDAFEAPKTESLKQPITRKLSRPLALSSNKVPHNMTHHKQLNSFIRPTTATAETLRAIHPKPSLIDIDFWENYDPAEVCQSGFGLIVTESVSLRALCFLCGSSGQDPLMFCVCCCEPYHQYCVEDEYNLKSQSLDEINISTLEVTTISQQTSRLNWLCPRCTVCYSCNMASGSKVKCQKCNKNYHSTCLGTSKRLSGADRPLICASCLKCKSCGTTNVSKFVGNLPMCSPCFRLRQKGNFCPLCQKCYEDNDFNIKMMECGDCRRWVHAKCEGLTDEQYNMLSVLPENIEFVCRKCAHNNSSADTWREAVAAEFRAGLLSVVRLLSKSRQACALLKLSPRKKSGSCVCKPVQANRMIAFGDECVDHESDNEFQGKSDSIDTKCFCGAAQPPATQHITNLTLLEIKSKVQINEYFSLADFNYDMDLITQAAACEELTIAYKEILSETFPWFQNETKACTDALEEDMYDSNDYNDGQMPTDDLDQHVPGIVGIPEDIEDYFYDPYETQDARTCLFCKGVGEGGSTNESRLLYCGQNGWVHTNCAMWSAEVFEEIDGSLQNVHSAISRGRLIKCSHCSSKGATVGCNVRNCGEHYHYPCAQLSGCAFMLDKTVYCPAHLTDADRQSCAQETNFEVIRPVYVELDRKKKKGMAPGKVQFVIGSLQVKHLGKYVAKLSDFDEHVIVPADFRCTRLYWSTKEPWKIVEYSVKTYVENNNQVIYQDLGKNMVVDHSRKDVAKRLAKIARWHVSLVNGAHMDEYGTDGMTSSDETNEDEPQSNANDLLPPELRDAILEDLPHDILDGISMLDIFPMDSRNEQFLNSDMSEMDDDFSDSTTKDYFGSGVDSWSHVEDALLSAASSRPSTSSRELKRSKSEIFAAAARHVSSSARGNQRSSSFTWNAKLDTNLLNAKRRKVSRVDGMFVPLANRQRYEMASSGFERRNSLFNEDTKSRNFNWNPIKMSTTDEVSSDGLAQRDVLDKLKISQLDGVDDLSSGSEAGSPLHEYSTVNMSFGPNMRQSPVKCDRCHCTYRTYDSFHRHLPTCEPLSTSESDSEHTTHTPDMQSPPQNMIVTSMGGQEFCNMPMIQQQQQQPHQQPQQQQQIFNLNGQQISLQNIQQAQPIHISQQNGNPGMQLPNQMQNVILNPTNGQQQLFATPSMQPQLFPIQNLGQTHFTAQDFQKCAGQSQTITLPNGMSLQAAQPSLMQQGQPQILTISQPGSNGSQLLQIANNPIHSMSGFSSSSSTTTTTSSTINRSSPYKKQLILPQPDKSIKRQPISKVVTTTARGTATKRPAKAAQVKQTIVKSASEHHIQQQQNHMQAKPIQMFTNQAMPIMRQTTGGNDIILQQAPNGQMIMQAQPTSNLVQYIGENGQIQYIALPTQQSDFKHPQPPAQQPFGMATNNPMLQGGYQLTTDASGNLVLSNSSAPTLQGLQMMPNGTLQLTTAPQQPQVIGTIIQNQPNGMMMATDQLGYGGQPTLEMITNPNTGGCMLVTTNQPMYYGLETIVQNTVMSSQQFVSSAMQGVLSQNSSFSATTTQVFQASKIEPIMEMPSGYVVLNNDGTIMQPQPHQNIINGGVQLQQGVPQIQAALPQIQPQPQAIPMNAINPNGNQAWRFIDDKSNIQLLPQHQPQPSTQASLQNHLMQQQVNLHSQEQQHSVQQSKTIVKSSPVNVSKIQPQQNMQFVASASTQSSQPQSTDQFKQSPMLLPKDGQQFVIQPQTHLNKAAIQQQIPIQQFKPVTSQSGNTVQPIQRKTNMIRPIAATTKVTNSVTVKPKLVSRPATKVQAIKSQIFNKTQNNVSSTNQPKSFASNQPIFAAPQFSQSNLIAPPNKPVQTLHNGRPSDTQFQGRTSFTVQPSIDEVGKMNTYTLAFTTTDPGSSSSDTCNTNTPTISCTILSTPSSSTASATPYQAKPFYSSATTHATITPPVSQFSSLNNFTQNSPPQPSTTIINLPTASIQLPTAPYAPSHSNGIPTNVVNPIQQPSQTQYASNYVNNTTSITPTISRPTNRVLPMQTQQPAKHQTPPIPSDVEPKIIDSILIKKAISVDTSPPKLSIVLEQDHSPNQLVIVEEKHDEDEEEEEQADNLSDEGSTAKVDSAMEIDDIDAKSDDSDSAVSFTEPTATTDELFDKLKCDTSDLLIRAPVVAAPVSEVVDAIVSVNIIEENPVIDQDPQNICNQEPVMLDNNGQESLSEAMTTEFEQPSVIEPTPTSDDCDRLLADQKENRNPTVTMENIEQATSNKRSLKTMLQEQSSMQQLQSVLSAPPAKPSGPKMLYEIQSQDGFTYKSTSVTEIWEKVFEAVQVTRKAHGLSPLPDGPLADMCGHQMLGLKTNALKYLVEQLPGVEKCSKYKPRYHKRSQSTGTTDPNSSGYSSDSEEPKENPFGASRCEGYSSRSEYDMFSWLASRHRKQPNVVIPAPNNDIELIPRRGTGSNLPMAMRYRTLKETYKETVGVYRSHIHGRGLFCNRDIEAGEMVIEYAGELIRSTLTDKRERYYDGRGIGCYMFKIDENLVVDATMRGNAARFINHACEPNCYSKVVDILGHKHIIIFALRRIVQGEELTYDYKFPFEETKIPCSCGSRKCRKYLN